MLILEVDPDMTLQGKVAVITGAGRGIGRAIAHRFANDGARLALVARTNTEIDAVASEIAAKGGTAIAIPTDVTTEADVNAMISRTVDELGPIDILVNNAGAILLRPLVNTSLDEWKEIMNVNLLGAFLCARGVLASMMERRTGRIINIGSLAGRRGYPEQGAYCVSKHGLCGLTKVLAIEGQPYGIRVNMVSPGGVVTTLTEGLRASRGKTQDKDWMTPEEVADGVYYVATQDGPATTDELVLRRNASEPWR
jgi:NAD(P)-dependent dehydrogenase (short-subunit alcohol dehydrogenase family)